MNIQRPLSRHLKASSALALTAIISMPAAQAFYNNQQSEFPAWSILLSNSFTDSNCAAFQITPRIAITTARCTKTYMPPQDWAGKTVYYPSLKFPMLGGLDASIYDGPNSYGPVGDVGIVFANMPFFGTTLQPANIMSYKNEKRALKDGDDALTAGASLSLFSVTPGKRLDRVATKSERYVYGQHPEEARPLVYRSVNKYRELEPKRFTIDTSNPIADPFVVDYLYETRKLSDQQVNSMVLFISGLESDPANGIGNPISASDTSGGVFYKANDGTLSLIGIISSQNVQPRLSYHWPWIYQKIMEKASRADAIAFANKVLGTNGWDSNNQQGIIGDIYVYDNPYNHDVEFFKLIGLKTDRRYGYFPTNKSNNQYWQYLGTSLPTFEQATTAVSN